MDRLALAIHNATGLQASELMPIASLAEEHGFEAILMTEASNDALGFIQAFASCTERIGLGTAIVNIYQRHPIQLVAQCAVIDDVSQQRLNYLGLGTSHRTINEKRFGVQMDKPLATMREYIEVARLVQTGEVTNYHGEVFTIDAFQYRLRPVRPRIPMYVAAMSKRILQLSGATADGVYLYLLPDAYSDWSIQQVHDGALAAGRNPDDVTIACLYMTLVHPSREKARAVAKQQIASYCSNPFYNRHLASAGYPDEAIKIWEASERGDREGAAAVVSEELIDALVVAGTPEECCQRIGEKRSLGIQLPVIFPFPVEQSWISCLQEATELFGPIVVSESVHR